MLGVTVHWIQVFQYSFSQSNLSRIRFCGFLFIVAMEMSISLKTILGTTTDVNFTLFQVWEDFLQKSRQFFKFYFVLLPSTELPTYEYTKHCS